MCVVSRGGKSAKFTVQFVNEVVCLHRNGHGFFNCASDMPGTGGSSAAGSETGRLMPRSGTEHLNLDNLREVIMDNGEKLKTLFEMWDEDASGTINQKEFRAALKTLGFTASDAHMNALFDKLDKDKSGQVDYKEMVKAVEGAGKKGKEKIALERKLLEEKRAREAAEARAAAGGGAAVEAAISTAVAAAVEQAKAEAQQQVQELQEQLEAARATAGGASPAVKAVQEQLIEIEEEKRSIKLEATALRDELDQLRRTTGQLERSDAEYRRQLKRLEEEALESKALREALEAMSAELEKMRQAFEQERQQWKTKEIELVQQVQQKASEWTQQKAGEVKRIEEQWTTKVRQRPHHLIASDCRPHRMASIIRFVNSRRRQQRFSKRILCVRRCKQQSSRPRRTGSSRKTRSIFGKSASCPGAPRQRRPRLPRGRSRWHLSFQSECIICPPHTRCMRRRISSLGPERWPASRRASGRS